MTDQPTLGELMRVIQAVREEQRDFRLAVDQRFDRLVSADVFNREIARVDGALATLNQNLGREVSDRREAVRLVRSDCEKENSETHARMDKVSANLKWMVAAIVLPVALFIANLVFAQQAGAGQ